MKINLTLALAIPNLCREVLGLVVNIFMKTKHDQLLSPLLLTLNFFSLHKQSLIHLACNKELVKEIKSYLNHKDEKLKLFSHNIIVNLDYDKGKNEILTF